MKNRLVLILLVSLMGLFLETRPVQAYIPIISELVVGRLLSSSYDRSRERREEEYRRRQFQREENYEAPRQSSSSSSDQHVCNCTECSRKRALEARNAPVVNMPDRLEDYLGVDLNRAAKHLLTCVVDMAEAEESNSVDSVKKFLDKPAVVEFFKAFANSNLDFAPLAKELPFLELLNKQGVPSEVIRANINRAIKNMGVDIKDLQTAAKEGRLNSDFLKEIFTNKKSEIKTIAVDFTAWGRISPRAMILRGFTAEDTDAERAKEDQKLEHSAKSLQAMLAVYTQFLSEERKQKMAEIFANAQEKNLNYTDTIVLLLKQVGPVVLKRLQEGDVAVPELQEALRIFYENVPPMEWSQVKSIVLADYHLRNLSDVFVEFDEAPVATGTVAQVHKAKVRVDGRIVDVAVKVWRPGFDEAVSEDLAVLQKGKDTITQYVNPKVFENYIQSLSRTLRQEGDPENEAKNIRDGSKVYHRPQDGIFSLELVPLNGKSHTRYTLITKFVEGATLAKADRTTEVSLMNAMRELSKVYAHWLAVMLNTSGSPLPGFMHGDLHPGNVKASDSKATFLDFGNVAILDKKQSRGIAKFFEGYAKKDTDLFIKGSEIIFGESEINMNVKKELEKSLKAEFKLNAPMSEVLEAFSAKLVENELTLFSSFIQLKRVVAQVENELRSLKTSYEARFVDVVSSGDLEAMTPVAIYDSVLKNLSQKDICKKILKKSKKKEKT